MNAAERAALIELAHCVEPADGGAGRLVRELGAQRALARIRAGTSGLRHGEGLRARLLGYAPDRALQEAERCGARIVTRSDPEWPTQLDALGERAPLALWVAGAADLRLLALRSLCVVGARACTSYGEEIARHWSARAAACGWTVISGAAFGIDAAAHRGALAAGGATIAVLAGGVDVPYPRAHAALIGQIVDDGLVVSETPPGEPVRRQRFLSRNRVIAALGRATLVVEAAERSGTTATAGAAVAMSRPVLAVPGPVTSPASAGCHRMIRDGEAILASDVGDVLDVLDLARDRGPAEGRQPGSVPAHDRDRLGQRERCVLDAMPGRGVVDLGALVRGAGLPSADVLAALGILASSGWLTEQGGGWRLARR